MIRKLLRRILRDRSLRSAAAQDLLALQKLPRIENAFLPWTQFALKPSALLTVLNEIVLGDMRTVLECGGGISTLYIAQVLKTLEPEGRLVTLEESDPWCRTLNGQLKRAGLDEVVTVLHAPLGSNTNAPATGDWYDTRSLVSILAEDSIDLLLVDGPSAWQARREQARYPALPSLNPYLKRSSLIVVDDVHREGEQEILKRWSSEFSVRFESRPEWERIALGRFVETNART